jgi:hypothetical protein
MASPGLTTASPFACIPLPWCPPYFPGGCWVGSDWSAQSIILPVAIGEGVYSDSFQESKLDHVGTGVLFIRVCLEAVWHHGEGRTLGGQQKPATWERGMVPLVLGEVPLEWGRATGVVWVTWVWWRRAGVQRAWSWGGRAIAWAILGSGLAIQSPSREGLPSVCWEAPAAGCQACPFCYTVVWLRSSFQKVCGGLGLQHNQSPTSLSGLHKPGVMVHTRNLVRRGRIRSSRPASAT